MNHTKLDSNLKTIIRFTLMGFIAGGSVGMLEYIYRLKTNDDPQALFPLLARSSFAGVTMILSIILFEAYLSRFFRKKSFLFIVVFRSIAYTIILSICLLIENLIWFIYNEGPVVLQLSNYLSGSTYIINLIIALTFIIIAMGFFQINKLHRRGELFNFIIGRFHSPKEVERIFCFIDLKGSTTIAEKLGHIQFANFLKDYYSDITEALSSTKAQIYQYVGDEIILSWPLSKGLKENRFVHCYFLMKQIIEEKKAKYISRYGFYPQFRAGLHGGKVIVTWIGEIKKEIVFIGDVLNTTARITENCKRVEKDFLVSEKLLLKISVLEGVDSIFIEEIKPRGKEESIRLYSLEQAS